MKIVRSLTILIFSLSFIDLGIIHHTAYAGRAISEQDIKASVLVIHKKGGGSGFYYDDSATNKYFFITAGHVLFQPTDVELTEFPSGFNISKKLSFRLRYDKEKTLLSFFGVMSNQEKEELFKAASDNDTLKKAIQSLYDKSQQQKLIDDSVTLFFYQDNNKVGTIQLQLQKLLEKGQIVQYSPHDIALVHIGDIIVEGEKRHLKFIDDVVTTENVTLYGMPSSAVKTFNDVFIGNSVIAFGYPISITRTNPALDVKVPLLRKGIIAGKNNDLKLIILDCPIHHGDSGGLVLELEDVFPIVRYQAIGILTNMILADDFSKAENSGFSVAVPMDDVLEIVKEWNTKKKSAESLNPIDR